MNISSTQIMYLTAILVISLGLAISKIKHLVAKLNQNKKQIETLTEQCEQLEHAITYQHAKTLAEQEENQAEKDDLLNHIQQLKYKQDQLIEFCKESKAKKERAVFAFERIKKREQRILNQQPNIIAR